MARKRKSGPRTASDRPSRAVTTAARDYGNIKVVERHNRFRHFIDDKGLVFEGTSPGRLWIVGGFDGHGVDPQVMRDVLIEYGKAYWGEYPSTSAVANYTQENRRGHTGGEHTDADIRGERFAMLDSILRNAGHQVRSAVHHVAVDSHWFPDRDRYWVARIINSRMVEKRAALRSPEIGIAGELAGDSDWAMLRLACEGAVALANGTNRGERRAA